MPRLGAGIPLVARGSEMNRLRAALDRARHGTAGAVLLSGDAGVGKSRLLDELAGQARAQGAVVLTGRCLDAGESGLPYLPFAEAIAAVPDDSADLLRTRPALGPLAPGLTDPGRRTATEAYAMPELFADPLPPGLLTPGAPRLQPDLSRLRLFDAVHGLFTELAAQGTVLLAIEDLHWADGSTRDLLSFLLARLRSQSILVVATYRSDDLHRRHPLRPLLAELFRLPVVERLDLEPFPPADARSFVAAVAGGTIPSLIVNEVAERSEGNAFFAEELVAALAGRHADDLAGGYGFRPVPSALADVLLSRIEQLSATAQHVVRTAAVAGRSVHYSRLAAAVNLAEAELETALRELVQHNVLLAVDPGSDGRGSGGGPGGVSGSGGVSAGGVCGSGGVSAIGTRQTYAFRHALLAEVVYTDLLPGERIRQHAAYARQLAGERARRGTAAELAYHSLRSNDLPQALSASVRAAEEASEASAPAEALAHLEQALELWDAVPTPVLCCNEDNLTLTSRASNAASSAGEAERAIAYARSAVRMADERADPALAAETRRLLATALIALDGLEQEAADIVRQGWQLVKDGEPSVTAAWLQALLATIQRWQGKPDQARQSAQEAVRMARLVDAMSAEADALITLAVLDDGAGRPSEAYDGLVLARERAAATGAYAVELRALINLGINRSDQGELSEAGRFFAEGARRADEEGLSLSMLGLGLRIFGAVAGYVAGDWDRSVEAARPPGSALTPLASAMLAAAGLAVTVGRGEFDEAGRTIDRLRAEPLPDLLIVAHISAAGAQLECWRDRPDKAVAHVKDALRRFDEQFRDPWQLVGIRLAVLGVAACADLAARARRRRDSQSADAAVKTGLDLLRHARTTAGKGSPRTGELGREGQAWLARAEAEAARLTGEDGPELWQKVVTAFDLGQPYEQALARRRLAAALLAADRREEAAAELREAAAVASGLGAQPLAQAVRQLARRARITIGDHNAGAGPDTHSGPGAGSGTAEAASGPPTVLTPRELAVLDQVALGRTNRQVGEELYISEKTVSVHLSRIMAKLDVGSRTEAVAAAYDKGLLTRRPG